MTAQAARNGLPGDSTAVNESAEVNQFLTSDAATVLCAGTQVLASTAGGGYGDWVPSLRLYDVDQPFTLSGTTVGRVTVPVVPSGAGADLLVSLCPDSSGIPGAAIASARIPKEWITGMAAVGSIPQPRVVDGPGGVVGAFNSMRLSDLVLTSFTAPQVSSNASLRNPSTAMTGAGWLIMVGGADSFALAGVPNVYTCQIFPDGTVGQPVPQPSLPSGVYEPAVCVMADNTVVVAGGLSGQSAPTAESGVFTASIDPATGRISAWSQQTSLPQAMAPFGIGSYGEFVYVIGGWNGSLTNYSKIFYAQVQNGSLSSWNTVTTPAIPLGGTVIGDRLVVVQMYTSNLQRPSYSAPLNSDGSLGAWTVGGTLPYAVEFAAVGTTDSGLVVVGGLDVATGLPVAVMQTLTTDDAGTGLFTQQTAPIALSSSTSGSLIRLGNGRWLMAVMSIGTSTLEVVTAQATLVPQLSVPLPASGLTDGGTYHVVMQQSGGDITNYLTPWMEYQALPSAGLWRPAGLSPWSSDFSAIRPIDLASESQFEFPIAVYDQSLAGAPMHLLGSVESRVLTLAPAASGRTLAVADATQFGDGTMLADVAAIFYDDGDVFPVRTQVQSVTSTITQTPPPRNVITNPDMEPPQDIAGWTVQYILGYTGGMKGTESIETASPLAGTQSLKTAELANAASWVQWIPSGNGSSPVVGEDIFETAPGEVWAAYALMRASAAMPGLKLIATTGPTPANLVQPAGGATTWTSFADIPCDANQTVLIGGEVTVPAGGNYIGLIAVAGNTGIPTSAWSWWLDEVWLWRK